MALVGLTILVVKGVAFLQREAASKPTSSSTASDQEEQKGLQWVKAHGGSVSYARSRKDATAYIAKVELKNAKLTEENLKELIRLEGLQQVNELNLYNTPVTRSGLQELAALKQLHDLNLGLTPLTDVDARALGQLKELQDLNLSSTNITDKGLKELAGLRQLKTLYLIDTQTTVRGVVELQQVLPECRIFSPSSEAEVAAVTALEKLGAKFMRNTRVPSLPVDAVELVGRATSPTNPSICSCTSSNCES